MCRLFGLHAGPEPIAATFWLLDAPDSLAAQSHRNPDGAGIGCCTPDGRIVLDKQPLAAYEDRKFATAARALRGTTFVAHVRYASTGARTVDNTHPFEQDGRLLAHNGVVSDLDQLDARLAELGGSHLVRGQTDTERVFALVTIETERASGDLGAGLVAAVGWIGRHCSLYAVNLVLATPTDLWALRYPATHDLLLLERRSGGPNPTTQTGQQLDARTDRIHARSDDLADQPAVVVASEPMDDDPGWRSLGDGELVHVGPDLTCTSTTPFDPPARQLTLQDLEPATAASQHPTEAVGSRGGHPGTSEVE